MLSVELKKERGIIRVNNLGLFYKHSRSNQKTGIAPIKHWEGQLIDLQNSSGRYVGMGDFVF